MRRFPFLLLAFLLVCACDAPRPEPAIGGIQEARSPSAGVGVADKPDSVSGVADSTTTDDAGAALAIDGDGLRVSILPSGASRPIPFGTGHDAVRRAISSVLGAVPLDEGTNVECRIDYATWEGGLTTWFVDDHFVGWSLRSGDVEITTASGVGIGSTRAEIEDSYVIQLLPSSSLGIEFTAGGIAGILDSSEADARVVNLWAGQTCIAR